MSITDFSCVIFWGLNALIPPNHILIPYAGTSNCNVFTLRYKLLCTDRWIDYLRRYPLKWLFTDVKTMKICLHSLHYTTTQTILMQNFKKGFSKTYCIIFLISLEISRINQFFFCGRTEIQINQIALRVRIVNCLY